MGKVAADITTSLDGFIVETTRVIASPGVAQLKFAVR
jgi:hypothetical protein